MIARIEHASVRYDYGTRAQCRLLLILATRVYARHTPTAARSNQLCSQYRRLQDVGIPAYGIPQQ